MVKFLDQFLLFVVTSHLLTSRVSATVGSAWRTQSGEHICTVYQAVCQERDQIMSGQRFLPQSFFSEMSWDDPAPFLALNIKLLSGAVTIQLYTVSIKDFLLFAIPKGILIILRITVTNSLKSFRSIWHYWWYLYTRHVITPYIVCVALILHMMRHELLTLCDFAQLLILVLTYETLIHVSPCFDTKEVFAYSEYNIGSVCV